jgi:hypothetical protein
MNSTYVVLGAVLLAAAMPACQRAPKQCLVGQDYFREFDDCLWRCNDPSRPLTERCFDPDGGVVRPPDVRDAVSDSGDVHRDTTADATVANDASDAGVSPDVADARDVNVVVDPSIAPPRPIAPTSATTTTSTAPTLRWSTGTDAAVELSRTRDFRTFDRFVTSSDDSFRAPSALAGGVWFWRVRGMRAGAIGARTSPIWWFRIPSADSPVDSTSAPVLDVNGDGYADIAVGAPNVDTARGRVDVYFGSASGVSSTPSATLFGPDPDGFFGRSVSSAGDLNGDGTTELVVGSAPNLGSNNAGAVFVFDGQEGGLASAPSRVLRGATGSDSFGSSVAGPGDVDGDGYADLIVGARNANGGAGGAFLYRGSASGATTPATDWNRENAFAGFGTPVAAGGDINGDGLADVLVGHAVHGELAVYLGRRGSVPTTASIRISGVAILPTISAFASSIAGLGDVDGDGYADVAVGASQTQVGAFNNAGLVRIYRGSRGGLVPTSIGGRDGDTPLTRFGWSIAGGDVNGDGLGDVVVGADEADMPRTDSGSVWIFLGVRGAAPSSTPVVVEGPSMNGARFGTAVSARGDVDGDGRSDLVVGAPQATPMGGTASLFMGRAAGVSAVPNVVLSIDSVSGGFGRSLTN